MKALLVTAAAAAALATLAGCTGGTPAPGSTTTGSTTTGTAAGTPTPTVDVAAASGTTSTATATSTGTATTATSTGTASPTRTAAVRASASRDVARFLDAARAADLAIEKARAAVRSDLDTKQTRIRPQTEALGARADQAVRKVSDLIPIGADGELLRPVLAMYAVLDGRQVSASVAQALIEEPTRKEYRATFEDGVGFARRFGRDERAVQVAAAAHRPIQRASGTSLFAAEVALRRSRIQISHICSSGAHLPATDDYPDVLWIHQSSTALKAKLGGYAYDLTLEGGRWQVQGGPDC